MQRRDGVVEGRRPLWVVSYGWWGRVGVKSMETGAAACNKMIYDDNGHGHQHLVGYLERSDGNGHNGEQALAGAR
jgi:hypothetical protein